MKTGIVYPFFGLNSIAWYAQWFKKSKYELFGEDYILMNNSGLFF